jgi:hypothetical protein
MSDALKVRRELYARLAATRLARRRTRKGLRRQIALMAPDRGWDDGGPAGVREPLRPKPSPGGLTA